MHKRILYLKSAAISIGTIKTTKLGRIQTAAQQERNKSYPSVLRSPVQIYDEYDGSQMAFKPAIPPPKRGDKPKAKHNNHGHTWAQSDLKTLCENVENNVELVIKKKRW